MKIIQLSTPLILLLSIESAPAEVMPPDTVMNGQDSLLFIRLETPRNLEETSFEDLEIQEDASELVEILDWLMENKIDLRRATLEDLERIPGLTRSEARLILDSLARYSEILIDNKPGALVRSGSDLVEKMRPYVMIDQTPRSRSARQVTRFLRLRTRLVRDLQARKGESSGEYTGSPFKFYERISMQISDDITSGIVLEKDAAEQIRHGFASGYVHVNDLGLFQTALIGDFVMEAGQGLVFWRGSSFGKGIESAVRVRKSGRGLQPYRSTDEFNFFRGFGMLSRFSTGRGHVEMGAFYSRRSLDASVRPDESISTFYEEGLFRTDSELNRRKSVREEYVGARVLCRDEIGLSLAVNLMQSTYDRDLGNTLPPGSSGNRNRVGGLDWEFQVDRVVFLDAPMLLFGEVARSDYSGSALLIGGTIEMVPRFGVTIVYRDYSPRFTNFRASSFGERAETRNETGFYVGLKVPIARALNLSGYVDHYRFPHRTYSIPFPARGSEIVFQADGKTSGKFGYAIQLASKKQESTLSLMDAAGRDVRAMGDRQQKKLRLTGIFTPNRNARLKSRIEMTEVNYPIPGNRERGYLVYQDVRVFPLPDVVLETRLAFFHTDSYDSRVYEYENDLRGVFSNPALYGKGKRWYVLLHLLPFDNFRFGLKYSVTQKEGVTNLGSGHATIIGDVDNRLAAQLDVDW